MKNHTTAGHICAFITVFFWGITFISTKILLRDFQPIEVLFFRFLLAFAALSLIYPHRLKVNDWRKEGVFALAGLCGITLYFLLENIALTFTTASNVGIILSVAPFFIAILTFFFHREQEKLHLNFFLGFVVAMAGICFISLNGSRMQLNPVGDILALLAAFVWGWYSIFTRKIGTYGYNTIQTTRRIFAYGLIFMIPALILFDFELGLDRFAEPVNLLNLLFLGLGASAVCFVTWNFAVKTLGAVKTSVYIYISPIITVIASAIDLHEQVTKLIILGTILTLLGLVLSENRSIFKKKKGIQPQNGAE